MNEFVKAVKDFVARDVMYIIGGSITAMSIAYCFGVLNILNEFSGERFLLAAGICYVIGYATQEFMSIVGIVTTSPFQPSKILLWVHGRFTNTNNSCVGELNLDLYPRLEHVQIESYNYKLLNRTVNLKHTGAAIGSSLLFSFTLLFVNALITNRYEPLLVSLVMLFFAIVLVTMCWVKGLQQMHITYRMLNHENTVTTTTRNTETSC